MPPLKAGLSLKRKIETENKVESKYEQESSNTKGLEELTLSELNIEGDSTDSEHEGNEEGSDQDQDEVLFKDSDVSSLEDEDVEYASDESSELTDSEAEGESVNSNDNNNADSEDSDTESDAESGIGHTHGSSSSESEKQILKNKQKKKIAKQKIKTKKPDKDLKEKSQNKKGTTSKGSVDRLADVIEGSSQMQPVEQKDEYESGDTSDEEERRNTVGDIPMWWYNEYPHIGYDLDGRKIVKPPQRDQIDEFLKKCEDPDFWRTVRDPSTGQDVVLSKEDLQLIQRIREGQVPNPDHDEYQPWVEWFSREVLATPLRAFPEHKRSFLPSRSEQLQIAKIVHALKMGWTKTRKQLAAERRDRREKKFYNLWGSTGEGEGRALHRPVPPPRRPPPPHAESYNPPPEYLLDAKEMKEWNKLKETPWKRKYTFLPTRHASLREVPAYQRFVRERFLRCLDLYLAPRAIKMRLTISASELVPRLPSPRELQPFPTGEALCLRGHAAPVRSVDFEPSGQYIVSGGDDGAVKIWETSTGRCLRTIELGEPVSRVLWSPAPALWLVAAAAGSRLLLLNPGTRIGHHRRAARTDLLLDEPPPQHDVQPDERTASAVKWERVTPEDWAKGIRIAITHFKPIVHVSWHGRGDYVAASVRAEGGRAVCVHQVSRRRSQLPLARLAGQVQAAHFHPARPLLAVATQRAVRLYDLLEQELVRKLRPGAQWISDFAFHPAGDNMLVASYDRKCMWFDLELSPRPYQTLRLHGGAVRALAFHRRYPLFATGGDDAHVVVSHGMVYNDLLQNPLIVPLKQIRGPEVKDELCVLDLRFHPTQPWLLAAGADSTIRLYS